MRAKRLLLLTLIFAASCKPPTPAERMDSILSWIGTAEMAGEAWLRRTTSDSYTRQTLELSHESIKHISTDLLASPPVGADIPALDSALTRSREGIARMAALIAAKNTPAFARELDSLRTNQKFLKRVSDGVTSKR